jgi:enoyl-CoA hydratase/carnithine racemase
MGCETISTSIDLTGVATLTLDRPGRKNAIDIRMRREISERLRSWAFDRAVRAVILTGAGSAFSAGGDPEERGLPGLEGEIARTWAACSRDLWCFPKPTIAAVNGPAAGGGFDLVTLCDLRICAEEAWFSHSELRSGGLPLFAPLRRIVGDGTARDLCLTRRRVSAAEALRLGIVRQVVPGDRLLARARALAHLVLEAPAEALRSLKDHMSHAGRTPARSSEAAGRRFAGKVGEQEEDLMLLTPS